MHFKIERNLNISVINYFLIQIVFEIKFDSLQDSKASSQVVKNYPDQIQIIILIFENLQEPTISRGYDYILHDKILLSGFSTSSQKKKKKKRSAILRALGIDA